MTVDCKEDALEQTETGRTSSLEEQHSVNLSWVRLDNTRAMESGVLQEQSKTVWHGKAKNCASTKDIL